MHSEFPGWLGTLVQTVSRFCVPFFFMVSGYFCYNELHQVDYSKKIKHVASITAFAFVFYTVLTIVRGGVFRSPRKKLYNGYCLMIR